MVKITKKAHNDIIKSENKGPVIRARGRNDIKYFWIFNKKESLKKNIIIHLHYILIFQYNTN